MTLCNIYCSYTYSCYSYKPPDLSQEPKKWFCGELRNDYNEFVRLFFVSVFLHLWGLLPNNHFWKHGFKQTHHFPLWLICHLVSHKSVAYSLLNLFMCLGREFHIYFRYVLPLYTPEVTSTWSSKALDMSTSAVFLRKASRTSQKHHLCFLYWVW